MKGEHIMRVIEQVKDVMCDELAQVIRHPIDMNALEVAYKAMDIIKDADTVLAMEGLTGGRSYNGNSFANSYAGNSMAGGDGYSGMYYPYMGYSFEQGRGQNAQRDSMGRYMDGGNSMNGGYYAGGSNTKEELKKLMERATNETEKEAIRVAIESMNN